VCLSPPYYAAVIVIRLDQESLSRAEIYSIALDGEMIDGFERI
jgi:hypothetical protein